MCSTKNVHYNLPANNKTRIEPNKRRKKSRDPREPIQKKLHTTTDVFKKKERELEIMCSTKMCTTIPLELMKPGQRQTKEEKRYEIYVNRAKRTVQETKIPER